MALKIITDFEMSEADLKKFNEEVKNSGFTKMMEKQRRANKTMLTSVTDAAKLRDVRRKIKTAFAGQRAEPVKVRLGARAGGTQAHVLWLKDLSLWFAMNKIGPDSKRYWNCFGTQNPNVNPNPSMIVQVNFPISGEGSYGGVVAQDDSGALYLVHTGRMGGGRERIGLKAFWENYQGTRGSLTVKRHQREVAIIGAVDSQAFLLDLLSFVREVERIKAAVKDPPA